MCAYPLPICLSSHSSSFPFIETFIKCIVSFWQPETQCSVHKQGVYVLSVFLVCRETDLCGRGPGMHRTVFIPDYNFTKICLEICGWPKGHWHHPSCQWVSFCAAFLWALLQSCVRNVISGFNCSHRGITHLFPFSFPENSFSDLLSHCAVSLQKCICYSPYSVTFVLAITYANTCLILSIIM